MEKHLLSCILLACLSVSILSLFAGCADQTAPETSPSIPITPEVFEESATSEPVLYNGITRLPYGEEDTQITLTGLPVYSVAGLSRTPHAREIFIYSSTAKIDWSPVGTLRELEKFTVNFTPAFQFSDLEGAEALESITILHVDSCDLSGIEKLGALRSLSLGGGKLLHPEKLKELEHLETLSLPGTGIETPHFLSGGLSSLQTLDLSYNPLGDLSMLTPDAFPNLKKITLTSSYCSEEVIRTIQSAFQEQPLKVETTDPYDENLRLIWNGGDFGDSCFFEGLPLGIEANTLSSCRDLELLLHVSAGRDLAPELSFLSSLSELRSLRLAGGGFSDVSFLKGMTHLTTLSLDGNMLTDTSLFDLAALTSLEDLILLGNPVTAEGLKALQKALPDTRIVAFSKEFADYYPKDVYDAAFAR